MASPAVIYMGQTSRIIKVVDSALMVHGFDRSGGGRKITSIVSVRLCGTRSGGEEARETRPAPSRREWSCSRLCCWFPALPAPPRSSAKPTPQAELNKLTKQAAALNKAYRGQLQDLEEIRVQAKKATDRSTGLKRALAKAEREVAEYAQTTYMGGSLDSVQLFGMDGARGASLLGSAATMSHLASQRAHQLERGSESSSSTPRRPRRPPRRRSTA